jgi:hypothetical protein
MYIEDGRERYKKCERSESGDLQATHPDIGRRVSYCDMLNAVNKLHETYVILALKITVLLHSPRNFEFLVTEKVNNSPRPGAGVEFNIKSLPSALIFSLISSKAFQHMPSIPVISTR